MTKLLLSLHVLAAVLAIGPVTVAASMFPRALRHTPRTPGAPGLPAAPSSPAARPDPSEPSTHRTPDNQVAPSEAGTYRTPAAHPDPDEPGAPDPTRASAARLAQDESGGSGAPGNDLAPNSPSASSGGDEALTTLRLLHRICRVYAGVGIAVPVFGFATASSLGVLGSPWLITSIFLTAAAAAVLALRILPDQETALTAAQRPDAAPDPRSIARLAMLTGLFNLLWATVTVLMIVRPGSTTGA